MEQGHKSPRPYDSDPERMERLTNNFAILLRDLIREARELAARTEPHRKKVLVDLRALLDEIPDHDQGIVLTRLQHQVQRALDAEGSPKVGISTGCVGRPGAGVNATENGVTVGACATVEGGKVTGGGVEVSVSY